MLTAKMKGFDFPGSLRGLLVAVLGIGLSATACSDDGGGTTFEPPADAMEVTETQVRALHLSDDGPAVDLWLDGARVAAVDGLAFGLGTDYLTIEAGSHTFDITPAGGALDDSVLTAEVDLPEDAWTTVVAYDTVSSLRALVLRDDPTDLGDGDIRIRPIHTARDVGVVDIWNIPMEGDAQELYSDVDFGDAGDYIDLPAGAYTLGFDVDEDMMPDVIFEIPALAAGTVANVFAVSDDSGVYLLAQTLESGIVRVDAKPDVPMPEDAMIRAIHLSPDAPSVDIFVNDGEAPAFNDLAFGEGSDYASLPADTYDFDVSPTGTTAGDSVLAIDGLSLAEGGSYTAVAYDSLKDGIKALALMDDDSGLADGDIRVRPIHAASAVGQVDIWNVPDMGDPSALYTDVDFGVAGDYIDLPAGAYTLGFDADDDMVPDLLFDIPALPAGTVANVFAVSNSGGEIYLLAQLQDSAVVRIDPTPAEVPEMASVRAIHLSSDAPSVDVFVNDAMSAAFSMVAFGQGTNYAELDAGTYDFDIAPSGTTASDSVLPIEDLMLSAGGFYTAAAYDTLENGIKALLLMDDYSDLADGNIRVRAIHTAWSVGTVDIWNIPSEGEAGKLYDDVPFGAAGDYYDLPAGAYTLGFDVDEDMNPDVIFQIPALEAGTVANVFATSDSMGGVHLNAQLQDGTVVKLDPWTPEVPEMANVRAIHLSPDAPGVDIFVNDGMDPAFMGLPFGESTDYAALDAGTYDFDISVSGTTAADSVLPIDGLMLDEGAWYTAVAYDTIGNGIKALALVDDYDDLADGNIRVRAIHTAWSVGTVDIWNIPSEGEAGKLYDDVPFGVAGDYYDLPAGAYTLGFDVDEDMNPDVIFEIPALEAGTIANVFAVSDDMGGVTLRAQLQDGNVATIPPAM